MVVGHNPTMAVPAWLIQLEDGDGADELLPDRQASRCFELSRSAV